MTQILLMIVIFMPIVAGGATLFFWDKFKKREMRQPYVGMSLAIHMLLSLLLSGIVISGRDISLVLYALTDNVVIAFYADPLSIIFILLISTMWLLVGIFSFEYMKHEEREEQFFLFYLIALGVLSGLAFSANLFTLYMFFELMTILTVPLVIHTRTKEALRAGYKYLLYSVCGATMALLGFMYLSKYVEDMTFIGGGVLIDQVNDPVLLVIIFCMIVGFGAKAGMFPLHAWLPTAHPVAPAPASAVLSGVITKAGVLAIIRVVYYVIGVKQIQGTWVQYAWMSLALLTVFLGSMMAYREKVVKKRLAYSTVSQVSYILLGLSTLHPIGFVGAVLHIVFHSVIKNGLFLAAGAVIYKTGAVVVEEWRGIGKKLPSIMICYTIVALGLVGIPPLSGFVSKWYLANGSLQSNVSYLNVIGPIILLISAFLTAAYLLTISIRGVLPVENECVNSNEQIVVSKRMTIPMMILAVFTILLGLFPQVLIEYVLQITTLVFK